MSKKVYSKKRVKRVIRAIIMGINHAGEHEFFMLQRAKDVQRYPRVWECAGGTLKSEENEKAIHALLREGSEEAGITITRIVAEVHNEIRPWVPQPRDTGEQFDEYHATHYLVETATIKHVRLSREHAGNGWFIPKQILIMKPLIRPSSYTAIMHLQQGLPEFLSKGFRFNHKHH